MAELRYTIDRYTVEFYSVDRKGSRRRWGDRIVNLYSGGRLVGKAVFSGSASDIPEPYAADGIIHYFAPLDQFPTLLELLGRGHSASILWKPAHDPKEPNDGDAVIIIEPIEGE